jgi:hypothetical protein
MWYWMGGLATEVLQQVEIGLTVFVKTNQFAIHSSTGGSDRPTLRQYMKCRFRDFLRRE